MVKKLLSAQYLPSVKGEKLTQSNSLFAVLKIPTVLIVLLLTFLSVMAHYGTYTYSTLLVETIDFLGGISMALLIFGIGSVPKRRGLTRVKEFWESGMNVCFGQDSINDPWCPASYGNLMNILDNGIHLAHTMSLQQLDPCLDLITFNGAKTLNVEDQYGVDVGKPANFLVLDATTPFEAVRQRAEVLASIRNGEYLFKKPEPSYDVELDLFRKTR